MAKQVTDRKHLPNNAANQITPETYIPTTEPNETFQIEENCSQCVKTQLKAVHRWNPPRGQMWSPLTVTCLVCNHKVSHKADAAECDRLRRKRPK